VSEFDSMSDEDVTYRYISTFGPPPVSTVTAGSEDWLRIMAPAFRAALKSGKAMSQAQGRKLDEQIHGKREDNVYW